MSFGPFDPAFFRSLRFRLSVWNTAVMLLTVAGSLVAVREGIRHTLIRETDQLLLAETVEFGLAIEQLHPDLAEIHREMDRKAVGHEAHGWFVQLLDAQGETLWSSVHTPVAQLIGLPPTQTSTVINVGSYRLAQRRLEKAGLPSYSVRIGTSLDFVAQDVDRLTRWMAPIGLAVVLIAPLGGYWLAGRATRPLAEIIRTAGRLRPSDMRERLVIRQTGDELDQLSQTINNLSDQIATYLDRHREFIANAAHELRSPLAAIQSSVEVALNNDRSIPEYQELLHAIIDECSGLTSLVNQLLLLAESDARGAEIRRDWVRLDQALMKSVDMFRAVAEDRGIHLQVAETPPCLMQGDAVRLWQVINNLIDNSLKFTPSGGQVTLRLSHEQQQIVLRVSDTGPGIAPEDLSHIFERFYRADKSRQRARQTRASGLGLSICQAIVEAHHGQISVESVLGQGSVFTVTFPAAQEPTALSANPPLEPVKI